MCCVVPGNLTGALSPVHAALIPGGQADVGPTLLLGPERGHSRPAGKGKLTWCPALRSKPFALRARACYPRAGGDPVASGPVRSGHDREQLSRCALALVIPAQAGIHRPRSGWVMYVNSFRAARDFISFDERQKKRSKEKTLSPTQLTRQRLACRHFSTRRRGSVEKRRTSMCAALRVSCLHR